jgi:hypothetical protein
MVCTLRYCPFSESFNSSGNAGIILWEDMYMKTGNCLVSEKCTNSSSLGDKHPRIIRQISNEWLMLGLVHLTTVDLW